MWLRGELSHLLIMWVVIQPTGNFLREIPSKASVDPGTETRTSCSAFAFATTRAMKQSLYILLPTNVISVKVCEDGCLLLFED